MSRNKLTKKEKEVVKRIRAVLIHLLHNGWAYPERTWRQEARVLAVMGVLTENLVVGHPFTKHFRAAFGWAEFGEWMEEVETDPIKFERLLLTKMKERQTE